MTQAKIEKLKMEPDFCLSKSKSFICLIFICIKSFHTPAGDPILKFPNKAN